jgi:hypothetical protein
MPGLAAPAPGRRRVRTPARQPDAGVDTGIVNAPTALFQEPNGSSPKIGPLRKGDLTILASRQKSNGWLNVVQFSTGHQGWVKADRLLIHYTARPASALDFRDELLGTTDLPSIAITNNSDKSLFVHLGTLPEVRVAPRATRTLTVPAGVYQYNAAAAQVLPAFGSKHLLTGSRYTWTFHIGRAGGTRRQRPVSPSLIAESKHLQAEVDSATAEVRVEKQQIAADQMALDLQVQAWKRHSEEIEAKRQTLDRTDQAALDAFNQLVDSANDELAAIREAEKRLDEAIEACNTKVDALNRAQERLRQIADSINGS